jgi:hypothetical protein
MSSRPLGMTAGAMLSLVVLVNLSVAEDTKAPPSPKELLKALEEAGKPGPEHKKLQPFVGDWNVTAKLWTDPSQPPAEAKGTVQRKWIMEGRFIQENAKIECGGKSFEALGLLGYDGAPKKYTMVRACGFCGALLHRTATLNDSGNKFECATDDCCPITGQKVHGRDEIVIESNDRIVINVYKTIDGKELKVQEIVSVRAK